MLDKAVAMFAAGIFLFNIAGVAEKAQYLVDCINQAKWRNFESAF